LVDREVRVGHRAGRDECRGPGAEAEQDEGAGDELNQSRVPAGPGADLNGAAVAVLAAEHPEEGRGAVTGEEQADDDAEHAYGIGLRAVEECSQAVTSFGQAGP